MTTDIAIQEQMDVIQYKRTLPDEDIRRRIIIFQLTDDWAADIKAGELCVPLAFTIELYRRILFRSGASGSSPISDHSA